MDKNLIWLIVNRKQLQFWKLKILFLCYAPLTSEPFFYSPCSILNVFFGQRQTDEMGLPMSKFQADPMEKRTSDLDSPLKVMPKYKILG